MTNELHGRSVRIPASSGTMHSPAAGQIGTLSYAGWEDWYCVYVNGQYYVRARAAELTPYLID